MKGFRFRLEKLRGLRSAEEQGRARALEEARASAARVQEIAERVARLETEVRDRIRAVLKDGPKAGVVHNLHVVLGQLNRQRAAADADWAQAERELETAEAEFQQALQERKILDRLRERQLNSWNRDEQRREQAVLDEMVRHRDGPARGAGS